MSKQEGVPKKSRFDFGFANDMEDDILPNTIDIAVTKAAPATTRITSTNTIKTALKPAELPAHE